MPDPFSVATGVAGLISLGIQVTGSLVNFYTSYKGQDSDVSRTTERLESLLHTFRILDAALQGRTFRPDEVEIIKNIESSIHNCDDLIQELKEEFENFHKASTSGVKRTIKVAARRVAYPFRQSTLQKLDEDISEIRNNLSPALDVLQFRDHQKTQDDITELRLLLEVVSASQISSTIRDWLKAPDATVNHNAACAKRHPGTGTWFAKGPIFTTWLIQDSSFLWVNGLPGCGKSVLCSTAIQYTFRHRRSDPGVGIAFFYFTFNDESKQDESAMLRALLLQLAGQHSGGHPGFTSLHASYQTGTPPAEVLVEHLRHLIRKFHQVYILLDALDETPRFERRDGVLNILDQMRKWHLPGLHILVTSRDEPDIRESLNPMREEQVVMKNDEISRDINGFILGRLKTDRELRKLDKYHGQIQQALMEGAQGIFRWIECQFESLKRCPKSEKRIKECLRSLPRGLDETYQRILCSIHEDSIEEARRILTLLCFSSSPLTVPELIDAIAVDLNEPAGLDVQSRLQDADDILSVCPGLIDVGAKRNNEAQFESNGDGDMEETPTFRIAHFSVQEYLESDRITQQKAAAFSLRSAAAHAEIAQICLVYLQEPGLSSGTLDQAKLEDFPLAHFAAIFWYHHYRSAGDTASQLDSLILRLFQSHQGSFCTWVRLHDVDDPWRTHARCLGTLDEIASPVYYASLLRLEVVLHKLINLCQNTASERRDLVNTQGGKYGNALQAASWYGHDKVVRILLNAGADVNAQGGFRRNALEEASANGHDKVVRILLDAGADMNAQGGAALRDASQSGHDKVVRILLDAGADMNAQSAYWGNALQVALARGTDKVVTMLLDAGADLNAQGGFWGNALQAASTGGYDKVVTMLLDAGADVNTQGGYCGNALQAASAEGHDKVVRMLLDAGANVNAQGGHWGNALQAASDEDHDKVVEILLDAGADVNAQGGYDGNALTAASSRGHDKVVRMLLDAGAYVNAQGGNNWDNALTAASLIGDDKVVRMLLDAGADVNALSKDGMDRFLALRSASVGGHDKVVRLLLDAGVDVNAQGKFFDNVLKAASGEPRDKVVQMLLDAGAINSS